MDGFTITRMQKLAEEYEVVLICPIFEIERKILFIIQQSSSMQAERFWEVIERFMFLKFLFGRRDIIFLLETMGFPFLKRSLHPSVSRSAGTISSQKVQEY